MLIMPKLCLAQINKKDTIVNLEHHLIQFKHHPNMHEGHHKLVLDRCGIRVEILVYLYVFVYVCVKVYPYSTF